MNLFYTDTAEHDAYNAVAQRFESIRANVGEYPPIIAASIQRIIRDETNASNELDKILERKDFDINRLNTEWEQPDALLNPRISVEDMEIPLRQPDLMPEGWSVKWAGGKHWDATDPSGKTRRVTTDREAYQNADGRLHWWQGPLHH